MWNISTQSILNRTKHDDSDDSFGWYDTGEVFGIQSDEIRESKRRNQRLMTCLKFRVSDDTHKQTTLSLLKSRYSPSPIGLLIFIELTITDETSLSIECCEGETTALNKLKLTLIPDNINFGIIRLIIKCVNIKLGYLIKATVSSVLSSSVQVTKTQVTDIDVPLEIAQSYGSQPILQQVKEFNYDQWVVMQIESLCRYLYDIAKLIRDINCIEAAAHFVEGCQYKACSSCQSSARIDQYDSLIEQGIIPRVKYCSDQNCGGSLCLAPFNTTLEEPNFKAALYTRFDQYISPHFDLQRCLNREEELLRRREESNYAAQERYYETYWVYKYSCARCGSKEPYGQYLHRIEHEEEMRAMLAMRQQNSPAKGAEDEDEEEEAEKAAGEGAQKNVSFCAKCKVPYLPAVEFNVQDFVQRNYHFLRQRASKVEKIRWEVEKAKERQRRTPPPMFKDSMGRYGGVYGDDSDGRQLDVMSSSLTDKGVMRVLFPDLDRQERRRRRKEEKMEKRRNREKEKEKEKEMEKERKGKAGSSRNQDSYEGSGHHGNKGNTAEMKDKEETKDKGAVRITLPDGLVEVGERGIVDKVDVDEGAMEGSFYLTTFAEPVKAVHPNSTAVTATTATALPHSDARIVFDDSLIASSLEGEDAAEKGSMFIGNKASTPDNVDAGVMEKHSPSPERDDGDGGDIAELLRGLSENIVPPTLPHPSLPPPMHCRVVWVGGRAGLYPLSNHPLYALEEESKEDKQKRNGSKEEEGEEEEQEIMLHHIYPDPSPANVLVRVACLHTTKLQLLKPLDMSELLTLRSNKSPHPTFTDTVSSISASGRTSSTPSTGVRITTIANTATSHGTNTTSSSSGAEIQALHDPSHPQHQFVGIRYFYATCSLDQVTATDQTYTIALPSVLRNRYKVLKYANCEYLDIPTLSFPTQTVAPNSASFSSFLWTNYEWQCVSSSDDGQSLLPLGAIFSVSVLPIDDVDVDSPHYLAPSIAPLPPATPISLDLVYELTFPVRALKEGDEGDVYGTFALYISPPVPPLLHLPAHVHTPIYIDPAHPKVFLRQLLEYTQQATRSFSLSPELRKIIGNVQESKEASFSLQGEMLRRQLREVEFLCELRES